MEGPVHAGISKVERNVDHWGMFQEMCLDARDIRQPLWAAKSGALTALFRNPFFTFLHPSRSLRDPS